VLPRYQTARNLSLALARENERHMYKRKRGTMSDCYKTSGSSPTNALTRPTVPAAPTPNTAPPRPKKSLNFPREHQEQLYQPANDGVVTLTDWATWLGYLYRHANLRERGRILACILNQGQLRDSVARRTILYDPFEASAKEHICSFWDECSDGRCEKEVANG
jgi:hypothetical protein